MDSSPLGRLPPELRNNIWELVMSCDEGIAFVVTAGPRHHPDIKVKLVSCYMEAWSIDAR